MFGQEKRPKKIQDVRSIKGAEHHCNFEVQFELTKKFHRERANREAFNKMIRFEFNLPTVLTFKRIEP